MAFTGENAYKAPLLEHYNAAGLEQRRQKRGDLGRLLTFEFKKVEKALQEHHVTRDIPEQEARQFLRELNDAARKVNYYCELIISSYTEEDKAKPENQEAYDRSKNYWAANYGATYTSLAKKLQEVIKSKKDQTEAIAAATATPTPIIPATGAATAALGGLAQDTGHLGAISKNPAARGSHSETDPSISITQGHIPPPAITTIPSTFPTIQPTPFYTAPHTSTPPMGGSSTGNHFGAIGESRRAGIDWVAGNDYNGIGRNNYPPLLNVSGHGQDQSQGQDRYLMMFSQTLASQYSIKNVIHRPFNGNPDAWPEFELLLVKASDQMDAMSFSQSAKLLELRKVLSSSAYDYIENIPITETNCFDTAFQILKMCFIANQSRLTTLVKKLLTLDMTNGSFHSRQHLHSTVVGYLQGTRAIGASPRQILTAIEISLVESRLDKKLRDDWYRLCSNRRDVSHVMGYDLDMNDMLNRLHETMLQQQRQEASLDLWEDTRPKHKNPPKRSCPAFAIAAGTPKNRALAKPKGGPKQNPSGGNQQSWKPPQRPQNKQGNSHSGNSHSGSGSIIVKCPFCKVGSSQSYTHKYPLTCRLIRSRQLSNDDILKKVKQLNLCINCFSEFHTARNCDSPSYLICRKPNCNQRHNWRLHGANFANLKGA